ncbi:hypothetical protein SAY87_027240 [Trapa incisa]|uniref:Uncharacterized protein n=1 Tax=Trapa incisa TaxID=236973 RepID=A0AAN7GRH0_9MYRT|nr:hypothetical protein SAY87_027240 [Trapa incisa]
MEMMDGMRSYRGAAVARAKVRLHMPLGEEKAKILTWLVLRDIMKEISVLQLLDITEMPAINIDISGSSSGSMTMEYGEDPLNFKS